MITISTDAIIAIIGVGIAALGSIFGFYLNITSKIAVLESQIRNHDGVHNEIKASLDKYDARLTLQLDDLKKQNARISN